ncbi:hypothetical protein D3P07_00755 [Paenibacillus sp. 1011MAR3C5]|uniref:hypothetical protein n=1 Tax=Paenibacillus sp. 1011MAR3C5 TaxID=1675787 RepID=UPI000E6BA904|nr:hypothetical protein [Paenibacillus sp. 1011MAR3C5]RJE90670.1 hypothetical protein D3P07_00755 [Paenibacillus sp. 1011MAR3C5]
MSRFEKIDKMLDLDNLAKHNRNFDRAHADLSSLQQQVSAEQQARMTADNAHTSSTTAHPADRITYSGPVSGARNVKEAIDSQNQRINGIVGQAGNSNSEIVDARAGSDGTVHPVLKARLDRMERRQMEDRDQTTMLNRGMNVVNTTQASGATVQVKGRTLVNITGSDGGCERLDSFSSYGSPVVLSTERFKTGSKSFKFVSNENSLLYKDYSYKLEWSKQYLLIGWIYIDSITQGNFAIRIYDKNNGVNQRYSAAASSTITGTWQLVYVKIPKNNVITTDGFRLYVGTSGVTSTTGTAFIDSFRIYEVSDADFATIGTTLKGDALDAYLPYIDGVKHLQGVNVRKRGKNLLLGVPDYIHNNAVLINQYNVSLNASAATDYGCLINPNVTPQTTYTFAWFRYSTSNYASVLEERADGSKYTERIILPAGNSSYGTFVTQSDVVRIRITMYAGTTGTFEFKDWMLVLGDADQLPALFEPRVDQYAHCPVPLASNADRSITDNYDSATGKVFRRWRTGVKLDRTMGWVFHSNFSGYKRIVRNVIADYVNDSAVAVKYDGSILRQDIINNAQNAPNEFRLNTAYGGVVLSVTNEDSGWIDNVNPNNNAVAALSNGWRASGNNGNSYTNWVSILTGAAPVTNTEAFVANNKAPGWEAWATLDYVLSTPVIEQIADDQGGLSLESGGNMIELLEGMVIREKVNPVRGVGVNTNNEYFINMQNVTTPSYEIPSGSQLNRRAALITAVYDGGNRNEKWKVVVSNNAYGTSRASIPVSELNDLNNVYVDYIVLDKHLYTSNALEASISYQTTLSSVVAQSAQDIASIKTHDGVQDWILAQHTARLLALEEA